MFIGEWKEGKPDDNGVIIGTKITSYKSHNKKFTFEFPNNDKTRIASYFKVNQDLFMGYFKFKNILL